MCPIQNFPINCTNGDREVTLPIKRADDGNRTHNRPLTKRLLCRLSYVGVLNVLLPGARHYTKSGVWGQGLDDEQTGLRRSLYVSYVSGLVNFKAFKIPRLPDQV
jgi:hypothetical protein